MVRRHLLPPVKYNPNQQQQQSDNYAISTPAPSMARILPLSSANTNNHVSINPVTSNTCNTSTTTATIQINRTPKCQVKMTSRLRSLLLEGHKKDMEAREMMPPPPPPSRPPPVFAIPRPPPTSTASNPYKQLLVKMVCNPLPLPAPAPAPVLIVPKNTTTSDEDQNKMLKMEESHDLSDAKSDGGSSGGGEQLEISEDLNVADLGRTLLVLFSYSLSRANNV